MKSQFSSLIVLSTLLLVIGCTSINPSEKNSTEAIAVSSAVLASWQEGATKQSIIDFVKKTTTEGSADFVPVADRIACFDNDGTLWSEQPLYFQLAFAMYQINKTAAQHPEWKQQQPFKAVLAGDMITVMAGGEKSLAAIMAATHAGLTTEQFTQSVKDWMANAQHPTTQKPFSAMIYQPMLELLQYLRKHGYTTFIVSGGGVDFMRAWAEEVYGIPPHQVVGSMGGYRYDFKEGKASLIKLPELTFNDDKAGKPVGIQRGIGKIPVFAAGNSDGDYEMLQYTSTAKGYPRMSLLVHHTDSTREWAYDRKSSIGHLDRALTEAPNYHWLVVDMQQDWKKIYP